jgi:hypothetical protein
MFSVIVQATKPADGALVGAAAAAAVAPIEAVEAFEAAEGACCCGGNCG